MDAREEFEIAVKCFTVMTPVEQGCALILFKASKIKGHIEAFIDAVHKVIKPKVNTNENTKSR